MNSRFWNSRSRVFYLTILMALWNSVHAQTWVRGHVKDSVTQGPVVGAVVKSTLSSSTADSNGSFTLKVLEEDVLSTSASGYFFDTVHFSISSGKPPIILLKPTGKMMQNVIISTNYSKYQRDSIKRRRTFFEGRSVISAVSTQPHPAGIIINIDHFNQNRNKQLKKREKLFNRSEIRAYIEYRFPPSFVQYYTGLQGSDLSKFMAIYTPSYEWLRTHLLDEEAIWYISEKMKTFRNKK
jgi:hypothetical protein